MKFLVIAAFLVVALQISSAKVFTRCELAKELLKQNFARGTLAQWVCLVESESSRNTALIAGPNFDGSYDYGLFQINDQYWCRVGSVGGDCNIDCKNLILDDITRASACAKIIWNRHGFSAWYGWLAKCQGALPDLSSCGI